MPGSTPPTSQLDWLSSTTAIIVLFWSRATRDLLRSFGWGIAALHRFMQRRSCHVLAARPIASPGTASTAFSQDPPWLRRRERISLVKNRMREICTSGSVRDGDGNAPIYSALGVPDRHQIPPERG